MNPAILTTTLPMLSAIPTNKIAREILYVIQGLLFEMGIDRHNRFDEIVYFIVVSVIAIAVAWGLRRLAIFILRKAITWRDSELGHELITAKTIVRATHIIPPLILMSFLPLAFEGDERLHEIILRVLWIYFTIAFGLGLNAFITFGWLRFDNKENSEKHPLKGLLGTAHGLVWIVVAIICVSIIVNRSPAYLLTGMAALSAAIMLIFKDSILGFVAGIQLSINDMLRVGDWIVVPSVNANGIVEDVSLTVVKMRAWDNTIIMLPPYTLVSTSFQNYRGMYDKGMRRIDQRFIVDIASVAPATDQLLQDLQQKLTLLKDFIQTATANRQAGKPNEFNGGTAPVNGTIDTNIGLFRAYLCQYLINHPCITDQYYLMVRLQTPTPHGVPVEIYCYTQGDAIYWTKYEAVQSEIMEHVISIAPMFGLRIYNAMDRGKVELTNQNDK